MSVTQVLMGAGQWSVSFKDRLPQSIRDRIMPLDYIAIGSPGLLDLGLSDANTLAALKAGGGYVGVITEIPDGSTLGGSDLSFLLGDANGIGPTNSAPIVRGSTNTTTWLDQFLPTNGIAKGTVTNGTSFAGAIPPESTDLEILNWVCEQSDVEWLMRPDGTVDVGPSTTLFPEPSPIAARIITRDRAGDEGGLQGVEAVRLDRGRDASTVVDRAVVFHSADADEIRFATASQTPTGVRWIGFRGETLTRTARLVAANLKAAAASAFANRAISRMSIDTREAVLSSRTFNVTSEVRPGDRVWVYDVEAGLTNPANQVIWRGVPITPLQMRVHALTWPIHRQLGVYARLDGGNQWIDLTPYVAFEDADVEWEVTISGRRRNGAPISSGIVEIPMGPWARNRSGLMNLSGQSSTSAKDGGWTPSWTNFTVGTGGSAANIGTYSIDGGEMRMTVRAVLGTTGQSVGTGVSLALPSGWRLRKAAAASIPLYGRARLVVAGVERDHGIIESDGASFTALRIRTATRATITATVPFTWAAGDVIDFSVVLPVEPV